MQALFVSAGQLVTISGGGDCRRVLPLAAAPIGAACDPHCPSIYALFSPKYMLDAAEEAVRLWASGGRAGKAAPAAAARVRSTLWNMAGCLNREQACKSTGGRRMQVPAAAGRRAGGA